MDARPYTAPIFLYLTLLTFVSYIVTRHLTQSIIDTFNKRTISNVALCLQPPAKAVPFSFHLLGLLHVCKRTRTLWWNQKDWRMGDRDWKASGESTWPFYQRTNWRCWVEFLQRIPEERKCTHSNKYFGVFKWKRNKKDKRPITADPSASALHEYAALELIHADRRDRLLRGDAHFHLDSQDDSIRRRRLKHPHCFSPFL